MKLSLVPTRAGLLFRCAILGAGCTVAGFLGAFWWPLDLASHFRVQYTAGFAALAVFAAVSRLRRQAAVHSVFFAVNFATLLPYLLARAPGPLPGPSVKFTVVVFNVHTDNHEHSRAVDFLQRLSADIVALEEVDETWLADLRALDALYPYRKAKLRGDNFGIALFSRLPPEALEIFDVPEVLVPAVRARFKVRDTPFEVVATHAAPPVGREHSAWRNGHLKYLAGLAAKASAPLVILGDLNCTPWSAHFEDLTREGHLVDVSRGFGLAPTWPCWAPPLLIPIDHCLHSPSMRVTRRARGPSLGSDHYPLVVEAEVPQGPARGG